MAFGYRYDHFKYLVMPFGLINASVSFQRMMHNIQKEFLDRVVVVYVNIMLMCSDTQTVDHSQISREMLRMMESHLVAGIEKYVVEEKDIEFLCSIIAE